MKLQTGTIALSLLKLSLNDRRYVSKASFRSIAKRYVVYYRHSLWRGYLCLVNHRKCSTQQ
jgi:hypothetical protein